MLKDLIYLPAISKNHMLGLARLGRSGPLGMSLISPRAL